MTLPRRGWKLRVVARTRYRIVVKGTLSPAFGAGFEGVTLERMNDTTALVKSVTDQTELYGILERLRNLGIELMSVDVLG